MQGKLRRLMRPCWAVMLVAAAVGLLSSPVAPTASPAASLSNVHPAVSVYADIHEGESIPVIVQVSGATSSLMAEVEQSGGEVTKDFHIINAFAAEIPADTLRLLERQPMVRWVSLDAPVLAEGKNDLSEDNVDVSNLATVYPYAANAVSVWNNGEESSTGDGIAVALLDSGVSSRDVRGPKLVRSVSFDSKNTTDEFGHGTHAAGIVAMDGSRNGGKYIGIAPDARIINVRVSDDKGKAVLSDVIEGLQWIVDYRDKFNIRVVNISMNAVVPDSYLRDPLDAAVEQAWLHDIVVVVSAGNFGTDTASVDHAPANDPFVITVGAFADMGTLDPTDDQLTDWSSRGTTLDGIAKPEVVAPGSDIISSLARRSYLAELLPDHIVDEDYLRLSGTSTSAAVVSGVVALMLEEDPTLTPDEVKFRLLEGADPLAGSAAPRVDAFDAVFSDSQGEANQGLIYNELIDPDSGTILRDSILWHSILWHSILWHSILWHSVVLQ